MTVGKAYALQTAVYALVEAAVFPLAVQVFDHAPSVPPDEFIRLDGFSMSAVSLKNKARGRHTFEVHFFGRPIAPYTVTRGQKRVKEVLAAVNAALDGARVEGELVSLEFMDIDVDNDGTTQHGRLRYAVTL